MASNRDRLLSFAARQRRRLDARISAFLRKVDQAESRVELLILRGILEGNLWQLRERRRLQAETQAALRQLFIERDQAIPSLTVDHILLGHRLVELAGGEVIPQSALEREMVRMLTENLVTDLGNAIQTVGRRTEDVFRKEGLRAARDRALGEGVTEASKRMQERLVKDGVTSFVDAAGRRWSLSHYSQMVVNTVTSEAQNRVTELLIVEKGLDVVEINSVVDPCNVCADHDGKVFSLMGSSDFPILRERPPFHGSCRHFIFPSSRTVEEAASRITVPRGLEVPFRQPEA